MNKEKNVKISFVANLIILIVGLSLKLINAFKEKRSFIITLAWKYIFAVLIIGIIIFMILVIKWLMDSKPKTKGIIKLILMFFALLFGSILFYCMPVKLIVTREEKYINQVQVLVDKVKSEQNGKYVYYLDDLKILNSDFQISPFGNEYKNGSYISKFGDLVFACITDGTHKVSGYADDLDYSKPIILKNCDFGIGDEEAKIYIPEKLKEKYQKEFEVLDCQRTGLVIPLSNGNGIQCNVKEKNSQTTFEVSISDVGLGVFDHYLD